jgi:hypothetical protein
MFEEKTLFIELGESQPYIVPILEIFLLFSKYVHSMFLIIFKTFQKTIKLCLQNEKNI